MPIIPGFYEPDYGTNLLRAELAKVDATLKRVRYLRLGKLLLEGENPEINTDKRTLVSRLEQLGFRSGIVDALNELEGKLRSATTPLDLRDCVEGTRLIYEEVVEDCATRAATLNLGGHPKPAIDGHLKTGHRK